MNHLDGKISLVTGAANGIGAACAEQLAQAGAFVIMTDIDKQAGSIKAEQIRNAGGDAQFHHLDVSRETSWNSVIELIQRQYDQLDVLVNNAGIALIKPIHHTTLEEWQNLCRVNIDGVFLGMKFCQPLMQRDTNKKSASIINLSSAVGIVGVPGALGYSMTKAAIRHMTKSAALEYAEFGFNIRVNSVHPGLTETQMSDDIHQVWAESGAFGTHDLQETRQVMLGLHPLKRYANPEDIAKGIVFLASDDASYMTGAELVIDGGYTAR
ncbi:MAG: SDR family oxidoreductase [Proteobacteria bacterium]|nr:SDR family oxidoreductase [Pseudomonadota bacterium]NOG59556.1 SDR family oxidoreductase [Pseudomonadota bacterium]